MEKCWITLNEVEMRELLCRGKDQKSQGIEPALMDLLHMARKPTNCLCSGWEGLTILPLPSANEKVPAFLRSTKGAVLCRSALI